MKELALQAVADGNRAQNRRDWSAAERAYLRAIELNPKDGESYAKLAHALQMQSSLTAAEPYARRAVELSPENADVRTTLGSILREQGHDSEAEQQFLTAVNLEPNNPRAEQALTELVKSQSHEFLKAPHPVEMDKVLEAQALGQSKAAADQAKLIAILQAPAAASSGGSPTPFLPGGVPTSEAGLVPRDALRTGSNVDAGAHLKSADYHGRQALLEKDNESMSMEARKGFETSGRNSGSLVYGETSAGRPAPAWATNLPVDTQIQQSVAYYQKLDALKADTVRKIEAVKEEQKSGKGEDAVLAAHLETLTNDLKRQESSQEQVKETVKGRVKHLGYVWNENAPPTTMEIKKKNKKK